MRGEEDFYEASAWVISTRESIYLNDIEIIKLAELIKEGGISFIEAFTLNMGNDNKSMLLCFMA